ncbi:MAG TPA: hypothetical protein VMT88_00830 [Actinomycetes bacterium]|nr:hypothetical protein [Actinomycetes bacterium]
MKRLITMALAAAMTLAMALPASAMVERDPLVRKDGHALSGCQMQLTHYGKSDWHHIAYRGWVRCDQNWDRLHVQYKLFHIHGWHRSDMSSWGFGDHAKGKHYLHREMRCGYHKRLSDQEYELRMFAIAQNGDHTPYVALITRRFTVRC